MAEGCLQLLHKESWTNASTPAAKPCLNSPDLTTDTTLYITTVAATADAPISINHHMFWKETLDKNSLSSSHTLTGIQTDFTPVILFEKGKSNSFLHLKYKNILLLCNSKQYLSKMNGTKGNCLTLGIPLAAVSPTRQMQLFKKLTNNSHRKEWL